MERERKTERVTERERERETHTHRERERERLLHDLFVNLMPISGTNRRVETAKNKSNRVQDNNNIITISLFGESLFKAHKQ